MDILCHRGLWGKKESFQNSIESIIAAFKKGWGVEIDLRLNEKGDIYLAHDEEEDPKTYLSDLLLSKSLLSSIKEIPTMALHIKEDTDEMFKALCKIVNPTTKIIIFGLRQSSQEKYAEIFGWSKIAYELETGLIGTVRGAMNSKAGVIWLVERAWAMEAIEYIKLFDKKIYLITPEVIIRRKELSELHLKYLKGVCTDDPEFYLKLINKNATA